MCYIFQIISHDSYDLSQFFVKVVVYCQTEYFSVLGPVIGSVLVRCVKNKVENKNQSYVF